MVWPTFRKDKEASPSLTIRRFRVEALDDALRVRKAKPVEVHGASTPRRHPQAQAYPEHLHEPRHRCRDLPAGAAARQPLREREHAAFDERLETKRDVGGGAQAEHELVKAAGPHPAAQSCDHRATGWGRVCPENGQAVPIRDQPGARRVFGRELHRYFPPEIGVVQKSEDGFARVEAEERQGGFSDVHEGVRRRVVAARREVGR